MKKFNEKRRKGFLTVEELGVKSALARTHVHKIYAEGYLHDGPNLNTVVIGCAGSGIIKNELDAQIMIDLLQMCTSCVITSRSVSGTCKRNASVCRKERIFDLLADFFVFISKMGKKK